MPDTALIVMARYPEVGATKTHLARMIGDEEAAHLYRAFLTDLARKFAGQPYDLYWACTPKGVDYFAFMVMLSLQEYQRQSSSAKLCYFSSDASSSGVLAIPKTTPYRLSITA